MAVEFKWDDDKARSNVRKHGVSFDEAMTVFYDPLSITIPDPYHSIGECRFLQLGISRQNRLLVISHTDREKCIRLINARLATSYERKMYESARH